MNARDMTASDRRYVVPTWAQSARYDGMRKRQRFELVDAILDAGARVVVLGADRTVHAWACGDAEALHYVYVPPELRGFGIAREVITHLFGSYPERIAITHEWPRASSRFLYRPHLITRTAA